MRRRWITVELGEQAATLCAPRLKKVIGGQDDGGVTEICDWKGGGGFRFYKLAPSLLEKDKKPQVLDLFERDDVVVNIFNISKFNEKAC